VWGVPKVQKKELSSDRGWLQASCCQLLASTSTSTTTSSSSSSSTLPYSSTEQHVALVRVGSPMCAVVLQCIPSPAGGGVVAPQRVCYPHQMFPLENNDPRAWFWAQGDPSSSSSQEEQEQECNNSTHLPLVHAEAVSVIPLLSRLSCLLVLCSSSRQWPSSRMASLGRVSTTG
jgi:hypothetical protein